MLPVIRTVAFSRRTVEFRKGATDVWLAARRGRRGFPFADTKTGTSFQAFPITDDITRSLLSRR
ncbi:MAG: hypothetical protein Kow0040_21920 [Thermogutta sp.]